jgi:hypothetical protein
LTHRRFGDIIDTSTTDQEIEMEDQVIAMYEDGFTMNEIAEAFNTDLDQVQEILAGYLDDEFDDSMDGDHDSALASAGYGMDEDYGMASEMDLY